MIELLAVVVFFILGISIQYLNNKYPDKNKDE